MAEVVFLAADLIANKVGLTPYSGAYLPQYHTLPHKQLGRLMLTELQETERIDNENMLHPDDRQNWEPDGRPYLVRQKVDPATEVKRIANADPDTLEYSVVKIPALAEHPEEIRSAQKYFLEGGSYWYNAKGAMARIEEHIIYRRERIPSTWSEERQQLYRDIADQMLESCVRFRVAAKRFLERDALCTKTANVDWVNPVATLVQKQL